MKLLFIAISIITGCTINLQIENESASGRDGGITEQSQAKEETTPTVDITSDVSGI